MPGEWIAPKAREIHAKHFGGEWEDTGGDVLQGHCPASHAHSQSNAKTDARIYLAYGPNGQTPGCYCLHGSCKPFLEKMNESFREELFRKDGTHGKGGPAAPGVARAPISKESWIPAYDESRLRHLVTAVPNVTEEWFMARSKIDVRKMTGGDFLETLYQPNERIIVFTEFKGPGDFLWEVGKGGYRLARQRGVRAVRSPLPVDGGKDGVWFLCNPVDGQWHANPRREGRFSRRSMESVTRWRYMVLESDEAPQELWFRFLAMAPMQTAAIYSSGGKSWHALLRVDCQTKADFDTLLRNKMKRILPIFGADPAAMTPVRLTRLPGCTRGGRLQKLIYLNPDVLDETPIRDMKPLRSI